LKQKPAACHLFRRIRAVHLTPSPICPSLSCPYLSGTLRMYE